MVLEFFELIFLEISEDYFSEYELITLPMPVLIFIIIIIIINIASIILEVCIHMRLKHVLKSLEKLIKKIQEPSKNA